METVSHPVLFTGSSLHISEIEQDSLADFIDAVPASTIAHVALGANDMNPAAVARARNVRNYLVARGVNKALIRLQPMAGIDARTVVISVQYAKALPPAPCPDWSKNSIVDYQSAGSSNFGCAVGNNFIIQLANPADYNSGHGTAVSESPRDSVVLQKYFSDAPQPGAGAGGSSGSPASSGGGSTTTTTSSP
jgi:type IV pilus biogenesis protein CpaD/CtpE